MNGEKNIILIGYRCTGKSAVGKCLAERLKMPFYDTDDLIERESGKTISELVAERGWPYFRQVEHDLIRELADLSGSVIAPGGGAVADPVNADHLQRSGIFVWLTADLPTILERMRRDGKSIGQRPALSGLDSIMEVSEVLRQRMPVYSRLAAFSVDTSRIGIQEVCDRICSLLKSGD